MGSEFHPKPHIVVVGAGIVGASIAWHLAMDPSGPDVTIVAEDVGGTATPCSFSWLNASWHNPRFYYDFRRRSIAGWRRLEKEVPGLKDLVRWSGSLSWDMPPEKLAQYQKEHSAWGYDIHRVERADIHALEPDLAADADFLPEWAVRVGGADEGAVESADAARLLIADAQRRGGARLVVAAAEGFSLRDDGSVAGVVVASAGSSSEEQKELLQADHVVLAAGVGCAKLCAAAGVAPLPLPVRAPPGLLVRSRPVPGGRRVLDRLVYTTRGHMRQTADGRVLGGSDFAGGDPGGADPAAVAAAQFELVRASFRPEAAALLELEGFTVGHRPTPEDGIPILGRTGRPGLSLAVMHSGVTNAALVGELLARSVLTGEEDPVLGDFSLGRFGERKAAAAAV